MNATSETPNLKTRVLSPVRSTSLAEEGGRRGAHSPEVESRDEDVVEQVDEEEGRLREEGAARVCALVAQ